ncbi:MAG: hypothetical protein BWK78_03440 [Thiotrichaceae bacterium IS1]|nr:MAG: hypothetical protein BWK78_03440 [Thiotrichaceae bacterium IS1]
MGYVYAEIQLKNPRLPELKPLEVKALVDTGALMLYIPEHLEDMDLVISPALRTLTVNPNSPNFPQALVK